VGAGVARGWGWAPGRGFETSPAPLPRLRRGPMFRCREDATVHAGAAKEETSLSRVLRNPGKARKARWLVATLTVTAIAITACGGGDGDENNAASTAASPSEPAAGGEEEPILIKTSLTFHDIVTGEVLGGSTVGDAPFCSGGMFRDREGNDIGSSDRTVRCSDGSLRIGLTTGTGAAGEQAGTWKIISGTGAYEGWQGSGQMEVKLKRGSDTKASETFTGTVTH